MAQLFLISRRDPEQTYMARQWGEPLYEATQGNGSSRLLDDPTRQEVEEQLAGADTILFFGHGNDSALGHPPVIDGANIHLASGVIVAIACWSANRLGPEARRAGAESFVGFSDEIHIIESPVIDRLLCDGLQALSAGAESPAEFEHRFKAACGEIQKEYLGARRNTEAHLVGAAAQTMKMALRVL